MEFIRRIDASVDGRRFYEKIRPKEDGTEERVACYPSVTTKLDDVVPKDAFLIKWIREQGLGGQAIFEKAGDEGTEVHIAIDRLIRGEPVLTEGMELKVKRRVQAFIDWVHEFKPKFIESEVMLWNDEFKFAGTRDLLCELDYTKGKTSYKGIYVVDYKTSSTLQEKHEIQVAAYWGCTSKEYKAALLHLGNRTVAGYSFKEFDAPAQFEKFKHYNQTYEMEYPNSEPKIEIYPQIFIL